MRWKKRQGRDTGPEGRGDACPKEKSGRRRNPRKKENGWMDGNVGVSFLCLSDSGEEKEKEDRFSSREPPSQ